MTHPEIAYYPGAPVNPETAHYPQETNGKKDVSNRTDSTAKRTTNSNVSTQSNPLLHNATRNVEIVRIDNTDRNRVILKQGERELGSVWASSMNGEEILLEHKIKDTDSRYDATTEKMIFYNGKNRTVTVVEPGILHSFDEVHGKIQKRMIATIRVAQEKNVSSRFLSRHRPEIVERSNGDLALQWTEDKTRLAQQPLPKGIPPKQQAKPVSGLPKGLCPNNLKNRL